MAKSDAVKLAEVSAQTEVFVRKYDLIKSVVHAVVILGLGVSAAWVMVTTLRAPRENVNALAECLAAVHLADIAKYVAIAICGCGWYLEHKRNNRLVRKEGDLRHAKESRDKVNTRSGLDRDGATPRN